jgi:hypothetical protein
MTLLNVEAWQQVGIVVDNFDRALVAHAESIPHASWSIYTYSADVFAERTFHGEPGSFAMRIALSDTWPQIELIEPLEGPSIYEGHRGIHHLGVYVASLSDSVHAMNAEGFDPIQSGRGYGMCGDGGFAYFDTTDHLNTIVEAIEKPAVRRRPDYVLWGRPARD